MAADASSCQTCDHPEPPDVITYNMEEGPITHAGGNNTEKISMILEFPVGCLASGRSRRGLGRREEDRTPLHNWSQQEPSMQVCTVNANARLHSKCARK